MSAFERQVGGGHYKEYVIQPYEFFYKNKIPHHKAAIIRRILRYDHPTGKGMEDLDKIIHEVELIKELVSRETAGTVEWLKNPISDREWKRHREELYKPDTTRQ